MNSTSTAASRAFIGIVAGSVLSAGMLLAAQDGLRAEERVLRVAVNADLQNLDPVSTTQAITANHGYMVYDTLLGLDANFEPQPQMLEGWEISADELTYRFTLREGLRWHDGAPVTAEDCVASILRWAERDGTGRLMMESVDEIRAVDDKSFEVVLDEPFGLLIPTLAKPQAYPLLMMPARIASTPATEQITDPTGSGPFIFVEEDWIPGSRVVYRRNEDYVPRSEPASYYAGGKIVNFDRVEWTVVRDAQTAFAALQRGEIDIWEEVPDDLLPLVQASPETEEYAISVLGGLYIVRMNHLQPPFDDPRGREALMWLIDQSDFVNAITSSPEFGRECAAFFVCGSPNETTVGAEAVIGHDPDRAVELFREAGWDGSKPLQIFLPTDRPVYNSAMLVLADAVRQIGFEVDVQAMDWASIGQARKNRGPVEEGGWNILPSGFGGFLSSSPVTNLYSFTCENSWIGWHCIEGLDELRSEYVQATSNEARSEIAAEMQALMYVSGAYIPIGQFIDVAAKRPEIAGVLETLGGNLYWNVRRVGE